MGSYADWLVALAAGALLAVMIQVNSVLAGHSTPLFASWLAHGVGAGAALLFVGISSGLARSTPDRNKPRREQAPLWAYLGGVPGAVTVVLAAITVNGGLALSGTIALMLVGQVVFGMAADNLGLFGIARRKTGPSDGVAVLAILSGSALLLFCGA